MIKHFSVLYVGHVELDNVGSDGTPADERRYPNEKLVQCFDMATRIARQMEEQGYYALWMAEHHFQREGYECVPNLLMLSTYLATQTQRLKFGCAFSIVPMWHPIRLAEDYAMADILTNGRVIFGVGRGYHTREVETMGSPMADNDANKELFEEQMEVLFKAFNEEQFSHRGKNYTIPAQVEYRGYQLEDVTLVPRPINRPVQIWQPIVSGRTIEYIAQNGINGVVHGTGELLVDQVFHTFQDASERSGRHLELGEDLALGLFFYIDETREEAMRRVEPYHDERYKWFAPFGLVRYADEEGRPWGTPGAPARTPSLQDGVDQKVWLCGPSSYAIDVLKEFEARYPGLEHVILHWPEGMSLAEYSDQLTRFADEVMPAFRT